MYHTIDDAVKEGGSLDPASFYRAFEQIEDGRKKRGKRYPLPLILTLVLLGKLAGETTISGIAQWVQEREAWLGCALDWPKRFPCQATYTATLARCDGQEIASVMAQVLLKARSVEQCGTEPSRVLHQHPTPELLHTALDGKTLRGTLGHASENQPPVHLVSLYECDSGLVLAQRAVASKENEITAAQAFAQPLLLKGRIVSADAMHCQKKWCAQVHGFQGYYLLIAKGNQPTLHEDLQAFFEDRDLDQGEWQTANWMQKGHGRLEKRAIWTSTQMNAWFEREWAGIAQVFQIRRWVKIREKEREEVVYGLTNLPRSRASADRLLALNRAHWAIENRLHYRRDVTLREDACQVRVKGAPAVLAALNGGLLALLDFLGVTNVARQMRFFCAHPHKAIQLLLGKLSKQDG